MQLKLLVLIVFAMISLSSCCDVDCPEPNECPEPDECAEPGDCVLYEGVLGEWVWTKSIGGFSGNAVLTPEAEGYTKRIVLDEYLYKVYINDTIELERQYDLEIRTQAYSGIYEFLSISNGNEYAIQLNGDTLYLHDLCFDCFRNEYVRD